jgi:hypothetical protein
METLVLKKRLDSSKKVTLDFPQYNEGDEVELVVVINSSLKPKNAEKNFFDIEQWANQWETDLGENIQSTDVESFTGRRF